MSADQYRHLTFLFCDLVDSTRLSQLLDHEDWRFVLGQFQHNCINRIEQAGGTIHENQGDGLLAYFGYPTAWEDCAIRGIRAAMSIIDDCRNQLTEANTLLISLNLPTLQVRVGVHSGQVVVGEIDGRDVATGFPLAFTERLHKCAQPNTLVISHDTRHLVTGRFKMIDLGLKKLKGIETPAPCYQVMSEIESQPNVNTQFVGRQTELGLLQTEWAQVVKGQGRSIVVTGEAGIGKSRLVTEFLNGVRRSSAKCWQLECSPNSRNSTLYPVAQGVRSLLKSTGDTFTHNTTGGEQTRQILQLIKGLPEVELLSKAITALLALSFGATQAELTITSQTKKEELLDSLVNWMLYESARQPLCFIIEDVRWADPSTAEFLNRLISHSANNPLLVILTDRTDKNKSAFSDLAHSHIKVDRLPVDEVLELVNHASRNASLSEAQITQLIERCDGIPLFVEESTAMLLGNPGLDMNSESAIRDESLRRGNVPMRLMDLLAERLDQVTDARETAGLAATIGREFPIELLSRISELPETDVQDHLLQLIRSGLLQQVASDRHKLIFKHALVRDAAYQALLKSTRRSYHLRVAEALESDSDSLSIASPEIIAYHFTRSGKTEQAIDSWLTAARVARLNSSPMDAINHYKQVTQLLSSNPPLPATAIHAREKELTTNIGMGACHIALNGYSSDDARRCYEAAEIIANELGAADKVLKAQFGLQAYHFMVGNFSRSLEIAQNCYTKVETYRNSLRPDHPVNVRLQTDVTLAQSCWAVGAVFFHQASFDKAIPLMEQSIKLCEGDASSLFKLVQSPALMSKLYLSWYKCEAGELDYALEAVESVVEEARQGGHVYTLGVALAFNACIHLFRHEYADTLSKATESIKHSKEPGFKTWLAWAKVLRGRARCESPNNRAEGLKEIKEGLQLWDEIGAAVTRPFALTLLAQALLLDHQYAQAQEINDKALAMVRHYGERYYEAEILRMRGVILLRDEPTAAKQSEAEQCFRESLEFSSKRGLTRSALRASLELGRLLEKGGNQEDALLVITHARSAICEGLETIDMTHADAMISKMRQRFKFESNRTPLV